MTDTKYIRQKYEEQKKRLIDNNNRTKRIIAVNQYLKKFNWAFVHPYLFGFEVDRFEEFKKHKINNEASIFEIFASSFFDLRTTAAFIDGYFKKRPSLAPFCQLIDQSVFMCLQRDYAGAINTLIPVIEGSIRHYLINNKGKKNESIMKSEDLLKAFQHLKSDYIQRQRNFYTNDYGKFFELGVTFNNDQVKQLLKYESEFIDIWLEIIKDYFQNSLYLDTRTGNTNDKLNRHSIFHGFNADIYYNLENFLKIYNCINFLSYIFGIADPNINALTDIETQDIIYKWKAFEKIKAISELTTKIKSSVYSKYSDFDKIAFEKNLLISKVDKIISKKPAIKLEERLRLIDTVINQSENKNNR